MKRDPSVYVADIVGEMERIQRFVRGLDHRAFRQNDLVVYGVIRAFEVMGEAAKHVPEKVRSRCPEVMWREMMGMRDRLAHHYWGIEIDFIWAAIHERFPIELPALRRLLAELEAGES